MSQCVVIGGGPAGLTAGAELLKLGYPAVVVEADQQVGGISRSVHHRGYHFDVGGHRFGSRVPAVLKYWQETLGPDFLKRPRLTRILYHDYFFEFPLRPMNALRGLGPIESARIGLSLLKARLFPNRDEKSFEQWLSNRFGHRLYSIFFKTYTEKVWGVPCSQIAASWATERVNNFSLRDMMKTMLFGRRDATTAKDAGGTPRFSEFWYPRLGPGQMWERLADRLAEGGRPVLCGQRVERLRHRGGKVEAAIVRGADGSTTEIAGAHFISSMPLKELTEALDPAPPAEVLRAGRALRHREYLAVVLIVKRAEVFPDNWIYIHDPAVQMGRIQNFKNWSADMVPDASRTSLGCEYFVWPDDEKLRWPKEKMIDFALRECERLKVVQRAEVEEAVVVNIKNAYPVFDDHHESNIDIVRGYLATLGNLQSIGRAGQHRYYNQDHAMLNGIYAAENVVGGSYQTWGIDDRVREADAEAAQRLVPTRIGAGEQAGAGDLSASPAKM